MIYTALGRENPHVFIRDDTSPFQRGHKTKPFSESKKFKGSQLPYKVRIQGGWLSLDAVVPDGGGGMRVGKSWLHSKPINKGRTSF